MNKQKGQNFIKSLEIAKQTASKMYLIIGEGLSDLEKTNTWGVFGEHIIDMKTLAMESGYKPATFKDFVYVYDMFGQHLGDELPAFGRLKHAVPYAKGKEKKWIEKALTLTLNDFNDDIRVERGEPRQSECEHKEVKVITKCTRCHKILGITIEPLE